MVDFCSCKPATARLFVLAVVLGMLSCSANSSDVLHGTWKVVDAPSEPTGNAPVSFNFHSDETFLLVFPTGVGPDRLTGTYAYSANGLILLYFDRHVDPWHGQWSKTGPDALVLEFDPLDEPRVFFCERERGKETMKAGPPVAGE